MAEADTHRPSAAVPITFFQVIDEFSMWCGVVVAEPSASNGMATFRIDPDWFVPVYPIGNYEFWEICEFRAEYTDFD
jgi:hypothetical protein